MVIVWQLPRPSFSLKRKKETRFMIIHQPLGSPFSSLSFPLIDVYQRFAPD
jgi:hypothetical protein